MLLAGDLGGTKTLLGLFRQTGTARPELVVSHEYATLEFPSATDILAAFLKTANVAADALDAACFGVPGPVIDQRVQPTNVDWAVDARELQASLKLKQVHLLNDLEAMAYSVEVLTPDEQVVLQAGDPKADGNAALVAAGTGLGEAALHRIDGRLVAAPAEAGHADFAARSEREWALVRMLTGLYGRATVEHVLSGPGLVNLHRFTHDGGACPAVDGVAEHDRPAAVTTAALEDRCPQCVEALAMFVSAYGAEAGNLALRTLATAGL